MMASSPEEDSQADSLPQLPSPPMARGNCRLVIGVTSEQTCLVLRGRLKALSLAGFEVTVVAAPGEWLRRFAEEEGVAVRALPMRRGIAPVADALSFVGLCWMLMWMRPAVTDFSTPKAGLLGNLAAWMLRVPHRVYTLRGLKLEGARGAKRLLLLWAERVAARCAHVVLCNSNSLRREAQMLGIAPEAKLRLLGDGSTRGVDTAAFSPGESGVRRELGIDDGGPVLGFVGRLTRDKGVPELLVAFEKILRSEPRCWLLLVGWYDRSEDALSEHLRAHIAAHPRIRHTGFVNDTAPYYRAMDLFVLPTHREGFPNVALEAAACGLAVITTESTGSRDAVLPEVTGLLIPPGVPEAIAEAVLRLLRDSRKRRQFGVAGRTWVQEKYSRERVLGLAVGFYRDLVSLPHPPDAARVDARVGIRDRG
ncbi:MAG TPA: glycosyltransferase family 4 protein [Acidobacteriaceae bacterium]|jgi:glycosyltransferase involved in cell wall biosynthesis|nr:glycosyltransferase family 4 protein [Acidobacteriaceae bacterium]